MRSLLKHPFPLNLLSIQLRNITPSDYQPIISVINDWWDGRNMSSMLPKLFFVHFQQASFVVEQEGEIFGFLVGFLSPAYAHEAYIHFVGVHPKHRSRGIGRMLYEHFFEQVRQEGRSLVRCVTSPLNQRSIAFHQHMGFQIEPGDSELNGISFFCNYDGCNEDRVLFFKQLPT